MSHENIFEDVEFHLIDFGLASKWMDSETGKHIEQTKTKSFKGNLYFSSTDQLECKRTSRRDDLCSLMYLLIYLLN